MAIAPPPVARRADIGGRSPRAARSDRRSAINFVLLVLVQVALRVGWIFKTESIIMPAVLDSLGGGGVLRGWLPLVNRFGQSVPPMLLAPWVRRTAKKKWWLCGVTSAMGVAFAVLSALWAWEVGFGGHLPLVFLAIYGLFFVCTGLNQITFSTLQGKLVRPARRGRLLLATQLAGVAGAVTAALVFLPGWLSAERVDFARVFAASASAFFVSSIVASLLIERADRGHAVGPPVVWSRRAMREVVSRFRKDANFCRLAVAAALFGTTITLFPHYQALGRGESLGGDFRSLLVWIVVQNVGTALFSLVVGPLADRRGNRAALRFAMAAICSAPVTASLLAAFGAGSAYPLVFVLLGLTPLVIRLLMNYTLEAVAATEHPRGIAAVNVAISVPVMASPLVGGLIDAIGYHAVFWSIAALAAAGWASAFGLQEPREAGSAA